MNSTKLTIRLAPSELEFAKGYAKEHGISLTALIHRFLDRLQSVTRSDVPPEVADIAGIAPSRANAREEYVSRMVEKHR